MTPDTNLTARPPFRRLAAIPAIAGWLALALLAPSRFQMIKANASLVVMIFLGALFFTTVAITGKAPKWFTWVPRRKSR